MKKRPHRSDNSDTAIRAISVADLERYGESWLYENDYSQHSKTTLAIRRFLISKLIGSYITGTTPNAAFCNCGNLWPIVARGTKNLEGIGEILR